MISNGILNNTRLTVGRVKPLFDFTQIMCPIISHAFGFGLMDAGATVRTAQVRETVPEQMRCEQVSHWSRRIT